MSSQKLIKPAKLKLDPKGKDSLPNVEKKDEAKVMEHTLQWRSLCKIKENVEMANETILEAVAYQIWKGGCMRSWWI